MAIYKLLLPKMGESVSEATLTKWVKQVGDQIEEDDAVVEIATDKVDSDVPSPVRGILRECLFEENQVIQVGEAIALIDTDHQDVGPEIQETKEQLPDTSVVPEESDRGKVEAMPIIDETQIPGIEEVGQSLREDQNTVSPSSDEIRFYSPLVRNIAQQEKISQQELDQIPGTGSEGRVTKDDVLNYLQTRDAHRVPGKDRIDTPPRANPKEIDVNANKSKGLGNEDEIIEMDRMRRLIADHMVQSVKTSPHVFSVVEADVTDLVNWRNRVKEEYKKNEGENITFTPLIIEAISKAIRDFPMINVSVDDYNIIRKRNINIGMATALPSGNLIVPVIKNVDQLSLTGISRSVNDLAKRSRAGELKPDDTQDGTFTFTNIGAFGNILGMPIINQPQVAILAVGTIKKKPAVLETDQGDVIAIRHMMYISMSYDHRVIDGALGGSFIRRVADYLESWDKERTL